jgi:hypothetical protein
MSKNILKKAVILGKIEAMKSPIHNRYCAILIYRNKIISMAYNTYKGPIYYGNKKQCIYVPNKYTLHAEQYCINKCKNKNILKDCILVLIKLDNQNKCIYGSPCDMCNNIIKKYKIKKIISIINP